MHTILFAGHMIDAHDRESPRFPAAKETHVKSEMINCLTEIKKLHPHLTGIAAGASGGDILFHEACMALDIPTEIYLVLLVEAFMGKSVSFAGQDWEKRYKKLVSELPVHIYNGLKEDNKIWTIANLWMLSKAAGNGIDHMTLLALWDGKKGDGDGGVEHMVKIVKERQGEVRVLAVE